MTKSCQQFIPLTNLRTITMSDDQIIPIFDQFDKVLSSLYQGSFLDFGLMDLTLEWHFLPKQQQFYDESYRFSSLLPTKKSLTFSIFKLGTGSKLNPVPKHDDFTDHLSYTRGTNGSPNVAAITALMVCMRFSAWSK